VLLNVETGKVLNEDPLKSTNGVVRYDDMEEYFHDFPFVYYTGVVDAELVIKDKR
jgi:hypothetical protein